MPGERPVGVAAHSMFRPAATEIKAARGTTAADQAFAVVGAGAASRLRQQYHDATEQ